MKKNTVFILLAAFNLFYTTSWSQDTISQVSWISKHPIEFSMGTHAIGLPFSRFLSSPYYPEINIGLQFNLLEKERINLNVLNGIGLAIHPFNGERYTVNTYLRFKYKFPLGIYSQIGLGVAFNVLTYPNEMYRLNSSGIYEEKNAVEIEWYSGGCIEIGYHLKCMKRLKLDLFSKYNAGVNFIHHPEIPIFPYNSIQLGIRFYIY